MQLIDVSEILRAVPIDFIDRLLNNLVMLWNFFFRHDSGLFKIGELILSNPYLLISVSLLIIGFVIGILKRIISL